MTAARVSLRAGLLTPVRPGRAVAMACALRHWGPTLAGAFAMAAARYPDRRAVVDEQRTLTFRALHERTNAQANALRAAGLGSGSRVGVLCRNHAGFVEATVALAKLGADAVFCNTGFGGPQLGQVLAREQVTFIVHDEEFRPLVTGAAPEVPGCLAWCDGEPSGSTLGELAETGDSGDPPTPRSPGRTTILTSGTTGTPKGATREHRHAIGPGIALLSALPLRSADVTVIAAPLFHSWGFAHLALGAVLGTTVVLERRFDPARTLRAVADERARGLVAIPVMLKRILDLPASVRAGNDTSSLRYVAVSGSALPGLLAPSFMDAFGDVLYNLYGSTEVAYATVAGPEDLRAAPGTAGRPLHGVTVELRDEWGRPVVAGERGRIFVGNPLVLQGGTDATAERVVRELMPTGDVGHIDASGRLFVDGREDDMIVSGGENVFPEEVESLLVQHPRIADAAVVGVPDAAFGQRLAAYVVATGPLTETEVREYVRRHLARHKVPRDVTIVDSLPRNTTGKLLRREL